MYGVQPTGFVRKPLTEILADIEAKLSAPEVFGALVIQSSESPLGQLNGLFADQANEMWEIAEDVYNSMDPDQAESTRLDSISKLRLVDRGLLTDIALRPEITNKGVTKFNLKAVEQEIEKVAGITYLQAFLNDDGALDSESFNAGDVGIAIIGGDDTELADVLVGVMGTGSTMFGNTNITTSAATGVSQEFKLIRVTEMPVQIALDIRLINETFDQFEPDPQTVINGIASEWQSSRVNGRDVSEFTLERIIYCKYPNIRLEAFTATVGGSEQPENQAVTINFDELAKITESDISVTFL